MTEHEVNEINLRQLCKELEQIAENIQKSGSMSIQDLEKLDKLYHTKKNLLKCEQEEKEYGYEGMSGARGRGPDGRYISRTGASYDDGYARGYSEAMNRMDRYDGHPARW